MNVAPCIKKWRDDNVDHPPPPKKWDVYIPPIPPKSTPMTKKFCPHSMLLGRAAVCQHLRASLNFYRF